jgi:hypothetical protein
MFMLFLLLSHSLVNNNNFFNIFLLRNYNLFYNISPYLQALLLLLNLIDFKFNINIFS